MALGEAPEACSLCASLMRQRPSLSPAQRKEQTPVCRPCYARQEREAIKLHGAA